MEIWNGMESNGVEWNNGNMEWNGIQKNNGKRFFEINFIFESQVKTFFPFSLKFEKKLSNSLLLEGTFFNL